MTKKQLKIENSGFVKTWDELYLNCDLMTLL